jgi:archaellum component FlaC
LVVYHGSMGKRKVTTEDLALMVKKGFDSVDKRFDGVDDRLDRIEKLILADHKRRIERLEEQVKDLRDLLAVK